jgi:hypothetical protein
MDWSQISADFEWDGSLRDIYVLGATEADWNNVLALLRGLEPPSFFTVDSVVQEMPRQVAAVFDLRKNHSPMLTVMVGAVWLNCHFFQGDDIEFDLDSRDISGSSQAEALASFMQLLGGATHKPVILCHENAQHAVIARYSPSDAGVVWERAREQ